MYNANPNYEMDFMILKDVNEHMEGLFQRFSKLLPFRIDFAYRKDTPSFGHSCRHSMCIEMHRLLREGANKQVISSQADSLIKISRIWADFFPANTSNQPI